jgi:flagellar biosynthesis/type III secretory pathway protein FliH
VFRALQIAFLLTSAAAFAAQNDYHLSQDPNRQVYLSSAFAHGHRHGYEEGFHAGDEDYQLRRPATLQQKLPKDRGYRREFGDRDFYMRGFETGFRAGYADSYSGKAFRLVRWFGAESSAIQKAQVQGFDQGVAAGYTAGFKNADSIADSESVAGLQKSGATSLAKNTH